MKQALFLLTLLFAVHFSYGQNLVMTFQPSGGLNNGTDSGTATAGKDTWVNRFAPNDNNGSSDVLYASPRSNCNPSDTKSYYKFDLTTLPVLVDSVLLGVTHKEHTSYCYSNCDADFYFYYVTSAWDEMGMVHSNEPTEDSIPFYGPINITFPNDFKNQEYDITNAYNQWKTNSASNFGLAIYSPNIGCNNASVSFYTYSSDDTLQTRRPYLKIYYRFPATIKDLNSETQVNAYPNPFTNVLMLDNEDFDLAYLTDLTGRKINIAYDPILKGFNTNALQAGLYILQLEKKAQTRSVKVYKSQ